MLVGRVEPVGQDRGRRVQPDDRDVRTRHRLAARASIDDAGGRADDVRLRAGERVEELGRLARMHRVDALAVAQLADGLAGRPPRSRHRNRATSDRAARPAPGPTVVLPAPIEPGDDDVAGKVAHAPKRMPVHSGRGCLPRRSRRPPSSASSVAASSGGCSAMAARAMGYRVAVLDPDPGCPAAAVADEVVVGSYEDVEAAVRLAGAERRRDLRAGARRRRRRRGGARRLVPVRPGHRSAAS